MPSSPAGDPPVVISRADAKAQGRKFFFTGKPCKWGHVVQRYTSHRGCTTCNATRGGAEWAKRRACCPEKTLIYAARHRAKRAGLEFRILPTDLIIPSNCPCCGRELVREKAKQSSDSPSLDRHDNSKGYVPGNVEIICWRCNKLKADATVDELTAILNYMKTPRQLH